MALIIDFMTNSVVLSEPVSKLTELSFVLQLLPPALDGIIAIEEAAS